MNLLDLSGAVMNAIESKGYFASFLIQDGLGMTAPRVATGFMRDKEETGEYNVKEGLEVLGREGMTGPFMISVAPLLIFLAGKFCKSAGTNTRLIKIIGGNLKEMVEKPSFSKEIRNNKELFRQEFYKYNIEKFYKDTVPNDKNSKGSIDYILNELKNFDSSESKVRKASKTNILNKINTRMTETSQSLDNICKLSVNVDGKTQTYDAERVIDAIYNYGKDAIERNPLSSEIDSKAAENIKNNFAAKRMMLNIGGITATLGGLSVLPKIYARNSVAPGAQHLVKQKEQQKKQKELSSTENQPTFQGKGINSEGILSKFGKILTKKVPAWFQGEFEYDGINFTKGMMACLSLFGLLLPRGLRAYNRAYVDENGNRDMTEIHEILLRDSISSLAVVYTVPILSKCFVSAYENKDGFVLTNKASRGKDKLHKFLDVINPYSALHIFDNKELEGIYGNINSKAKMLNFANYINEKDGDLQKIFSRSKNAQEIFNKSTFTLESIAGDSRKVKNEKIISLFEKMKDGKETDSKIFKLMMDKVDKKGKAKSSITSMARGLNSVPTFFVTAVVSPIILGCLIPLLTYSNTRKAHAKMMSEKNNNDSANSKVKMVA